MKTEAVSVQIVQKLSQRVAFAVKMLSRIGNEYDFLNPIIFSDEATFHVSNKVNISTTAEFGARKSAVERNSPEINVWCALLHDTVIGPFLFADTSVTANTYLDMLQSFAIPQMQHLQPTDIFQQVAGARMFEHFAGTGLPAGYPQTY
ncbi:hypothetical protein AVEN_211209-1 [Araneus ventricosus]|uniref:Tc1-like transposase DDE domain-containing protein n=1 Tax=Araneus ventricosus TaxID=182803 RepID=A0A4Y2N3I2_ARAVE|nr:hypothetical protein AVEN_211209-1 [Araneus ventricosus]